MENNAFISYLKEILIRYQSESPEFFKILQRIFGFIFLIPSALIAAQYFGITLPDVIAVFADKTIALLGLLGFGGFGLPVKDKVEEKTITSIDGSEVTVKVEKPALPYTDSVTPKGETIAVTKEVEVEKTEETN